MFSVQYIKKRAAWGLLFLVGIFLTACSSEPLPQKEYSLDQSIPLPHAVTANPPGGALMLSSNTRAGDALGSMLLPRVGSGGAILVTTMVDMENFEKSSSFGRTSMQQISSRLSQHGFKVLEARLGSALRFERRAGEFMLTRDSMRLLTENHDAHAVLVGTYSESRDKVFVSVRVVRLVDNAILGAYEYYLPKNDDVDALIWSGQDASGGAYTSSGAASSTPGYDSRTNSLWKRYAPREQAFK